jgi:outer membrane protein assembly factor BamE (lipoprotein component of BamABCDE complex)
MFASRFLSTIVIVSGLILSGCTDKRIRKANVDEVSDGMAKKQVESILGQPTSETKDSQNRTTAYIYKQGKESVTIVFKDDKVQSKQSTLSE